MERKFYAMNFLEKYLNEEEINEIINTYEPTILNKLKEKNFLNIINDLKQNQIDYIKDIVIYFLDLFLLDYRDFISKFEKIKEVLGANFKDIIGENINILESMIE